jgi:ABC-type transport system involved in multi-copper enzyme maturation permease subunit
MTALAPSIYAPSLVRSDLLKLRKRRSLSVVVGLLTIGAIAIMYTIVELLHVSDSAKHGVAGGIENLGHGTFLIALLGAAAAAIVGSTAGAADLDAGVYRDLVVTGRSRLALFASRLTGGLAYLLPFVAVAYTATCVISVALRGSLPAPSVHLMVVTGLWAVLSVTFYYLLAVAVASLTGSRSYTIGIVLAWTLALSPIISSISALGIVRELVPSAALGRIGPSALRDTLSQGPVVQMSVAAGIAVLVTWAVVLLAAGAWRDTHRDV